MKNVSHGRCRPPNVLKRRKMLANQDHATLKTMVRGATMEKMKPGHAPGAAKPPVRLLKKSDIKLFLLMKPNRTDRLYIPSNRSQAWALLLWLRARAAPRYGPENGPVSL